MKIFFYHNPHWFDLFPNSVFGYVCTAGLPVLAMGVYHLGGGMSQREDSMSVNYPPLNKVGTTNMDT